MKYIIETKRCLIRQFNLDDLEDVFEFNSDEKVIRYTGDTLIQSKEEAKKIIEDIWLKEYKEFGFARWAVWHKADKKVIGFAGLKNETEINAVDLGYRFSPKYWGQGIATEVSIPIIRYGFEQLGLKRIIAIAMTENAASIRVMEKIGMKWYKTATWPKENKDLEWYEILVPVL